MKKFAFYCSGGASRVLRFYSENKFEDYPVSFILYDGTNDEVVEKLSKFIPNEKLVRLSNQNQSLKKAETSILISNIILDLLVKNDVDYLYCFGDKILKGDLINRYQNRIINFHPSLLPSFPGLYAIDQALNSSVQILGNTAHFIDSGIDTGPIIMQSVISRVQYKNYEDVLGLQIQMLKKIWLLLNLNKIKVQKNKVIIDFESNNQPFFSI